MQNETPLNDALKTDMTSGAAATKEDFNSPAQAASKPRAKNWKRANRSKTRLQDNHWPRRVLFTTATLVAISVFAFITIAPLLTWQTTFVTLAIDNYKFGLINLWRIEMKTSLLSRKRYKGDVVRRQVEML